MNDDMEPGKPCWRCEARPDVGCRHRPAVEPVVRPPPREDRRRTNKDQGTCWKLRNRMLGEPRSRSALRY